MTLVEEIGVGQTAGCATQAGFSILNPTEDTLNAGARCVIDINEDAYRDSTTGTCPKVWEVRDD